MKALRSGQLHQITVTFLFFAAFEFTEPKLHRDCSLLPSFAEISGFRPNSHIAKGPYYTCKVQGTTQGTIQEVSLIVGYQLPFLQGLYFVQIEMICVTPENSTWSYKYPKDYQDPLPDSGSGAAVHYANMNALMNCSSCTKYADNDNHCQACDSACDIGLMRCTGTSAADCCVAFEDDGVCKADLNCTRENFIANNDNNFNCECGLSCMPGYSLVNSSCSCVLANVCLADNPCVNGVCYLEPSQSPDQYTCICTDRFTGPNCSECNTSSLECPSGYAINATACSCYKESICKIDNPCINGGICKPGNAHADQYTCDCAPSNFSGQNCSECHLKHCLKGFTKDTTLCACVKDNICRINNPCVNGVCEVKNNQSTAYICDCSGTKFIGRNCSECSLVECLHNGTLDTNCTCNCSEGYTGHNCSECADKYIYIDGDCVPNDEPEFKYLLVVVVSAAVLIAVIVSIIAVCCTIICCRRKKGSWSPHASAAESKRSTDYSI